MELVRYARNAHHGVFHCVEKITEGTLVALCGRSANGMSLLLSRAGQHTECRACGRRRAQRGATLAGHPYLALPDRVGDAAKVDVIRVAVRTYRAPGAFRTRHLAYVHVNCACLIGASLVGLYDNLPDAKAHAAGLAAGSFRYCRRPPGTGAAGQAVRQSADGETSQGVR
ncbi:hypothetical protein WEB32_34040 [Streptomyces netropsis]|uniref:hypothetical protein n=1 Tax=Streptomyces netropsis TaxID=55404 RepID=UPI0030D115D9